MTDTRSVRSRGSRRVPSPPMSGRVRFLDDEFVVRVGQAHYSSWPPTKEKLYELACSDVHLPTQRESRRRRRATVSTIRHTAHS